jgi:glycosyltransferase involved in cell wall biosynthesis
LTFLAHGDAAGVEPVVVAPAEGRLADVLRERGYPHVAWPAEGNRALDRLAVSLERRRIDLLHANSLMTADAAVALARLLKRPAVAHVRDIMNVSTARRDRLNELAALVAVSDAVAEWLHGIGVEPRRITRIYNAVDVAALRKAASPSALRRELGVNSATPLVGCIGQIALRKGQDLFLAAAAHVASTHPDAQFVIVGERYSEKAESRTFEADLHARASKPPLAGRTHFLGYRDDVPSILSGLDVVVVPSRQEPLSRVLLEALALEVPAVATRVSGSPEILADGKAGLLVPPEEPHAMAEGILRLLHDAALRRRLGEAGVRCAQETFSLDRHTAQMRALYCSVLS